MPIVLETVTLGSSRRKRQPDRADPGLNGGFLIDAEHGGMLRRPQIQADNVGRFAFELRIVAGQVTLQAMGFEPGFFPDPMHRVFADTQGGCQFPATPMGGTVAGFPAGGRQNAGPQSRSQNCSLLAGMIVSSPSSPDSRKRCFQRMMVVAPGLQPALNGVERGSFCQHQDELGAKDVAGRQGARLSDAAEFRTLVAVRDTSLTVAIPT